MLRDRWRCRQRSGLKRSTGVGPLERLGQHLVEVADEGNEAVAQIVKRAEAGPLQ